MKLLYQPTLPPLRVLLKAPTARGVAVTTFSAISLRSLPALWRLRAAQLN